MAPQRNYQELVNRQRTCFLSGNTRVLADRMDRLQRLYEAIKRHEADILASLEADLHKHAFEGYLSEVGIVLDELGSFIRNLPRWMKAERIRTPLTQFPARSFTIAEPYGVVLIMAPWNYPFQLSMVPLIGALAAGNTVILKPSAYAKHTSAMVSRLIEEVFDPELVAVVEGGRSENQQLLEQKFDYIFFTGSVSVGKLVMEKASRHLTPVTLELGGKSPAIVDKSANIALAAKRIAFGKLLNAGQTCIAPDYVLVEKSIKDRFVDGLKSAIEEFFPKGDYSNLPSIINEKHYRRLQSLIMNQHIVMGGTGNDGSLQLLPTILDDVLFDSPVMQEEIFGPILPIITFTSIDEVVTDISSRPSPLALYLFTSDKMVEERLTTELRYGGGCINDTVVHFANPHMGFGGMGESGMGSYHGKSSFDTFSHHKGIVKRYNWCDLPFRYHPYTKSKMNIVRRLLK